MVFYQCYRCGYSNNDKTKMRSHINRKTPCIAKLNNITLDECKEYILQGLSYEESTQINKSTFSQQKNNNKSTFSQQKNNIKSTSSQQNVNNKSTKGEYECQYCNKILSYKQSYYRHLKICTEKKQDDEVKESMTELVKLLNKKLEEKDKELEKQNKELEKQNKKFEKELTKRDKELDRRNKQIDELIKKAGINNSNNTINVQNNIKLLSYSDTDRSHLTDRDILKCLKHSNFCIPHLIEKVHFDVNKPENHNIYISNLKNKYVMMYDGNKWKCADRDEQITNLIDDNETIIEYRLEEWIENGNKYPEMMRKFNRYIEKKDNNKVINKIKDEIKLLLYNNRNVVSKNSSDKAIEVN